MEWPFPGVLVIAPLFQIFTVVICFVSLWGAVRVAISVGS